MLLVDNCPAHPDIQCSNVKMTFLPPNTTSHLQPCDAGIIQTVKLHYRTCKCLLRHVVAKMDEVNTAAELAKQVDIVDAIWWLSRAWDCVFSDTIIKCFAKFGFDNSLNQDSDTDSVEGLAEPEETNEQFSELLNGTSMEEFVSFDNSTDVCNTHDSNWKEHIIAKARGETNEVESDDLG